MRIYRAMEERAARSRRESPGAPPLMGPGSLPERALALIDRLTLPALSRLLNSSSPMEVESIRHSIRRSLRRILDSLAAIILTASLIERGIYLVERKRRRGTVSDGSMRRRPSMRESILTRHIQPRDMEMVLRHLMKNLEAVEKPSAVAVNLIDPSSKTEMERPGVENIRGREMTARNREATAIILRRLLRRLERPAAMRDRVRGSIDLAVRGRGLV